jgi:Tfp pilus assembly protein PilN
MMRINLLPKEVQERRRYEGLYRYVAYIAIFGLAAVALAWGWLFFSVGVTESQLQQLNEQAQQTNQQAQQLSIFQNKEDELQARQVVAQTALAGRVNTGQIANDISLVLPDEVWLDLLTINQDTGVVVSGNTPRNAGESTDVAYKSVAKTLVRLNELPQLYDVWLNTASNTTWSQWATIANGQGTPLPVNVVAFQASGKVMRPGQASGATGSTGASGTPTGAANAAQNAVNQANGATAQTQQSAGGQ